MDYIENRTFEEINIGDSASLVRTLSMKDIQLFAIMSGDVNPAHVDEEYAKSEMFQKIIAHGMWGGALISTVLGTKLPGPGTIYLGQTLRFRRPVGVGETITTSVTAVSKDEEKYRITFECECVNQDGEPVIKGTAEVIAPREKVKRPRALLPEVHLHDRGAQYRRLIAMTEGMKPLRTAVVHPVGSNSLRGAIEAAEANLIIPVLIGPEAKIRIVAEKEAIDLSPYQLINTEHSGDSAASAVSLARGGEVEALMKGRIQTSELMQAAVAQYTGLGTGRRMSHVAVVDVPTYPRPLFITDVSINIYPTLEHKRDITQNAINLALTLGIDNPKVAVLSAIETINPKINSSVEAAALCKMAERGQITGGIVDGPLAFDDAVSADAALVKGISSAVAGQADILVVPDVEAGTMLTKQLEYLAEAQAADIVVGARVPIILPGRADTSLARRASCAVALLLARQKLA